MNSVNYNEPIKLNRKLSINYNILEFIGTIVHLAKSGRLIIKVNRKLEPGCILIDPKGVGIAKVIEMIGPVKSPYASAIPLIKKINNITNMKVAIAPEVR